MASVVASARSHYRHHALQRPAGVGVPLGALFGVVSAASILLWGPIGVSGTYLRLRGRDDPGVRSGLCRQRYPYLGKWDNFFSLKRFSCMGFRDWRVRLPRPPGRGCEIRLRAKQSTTVRRYANAFLGGFLIIFGVAWRGDEHPATSSFPPAVVAQWLHLRCRRLCLGHRLAKCIPARRRCHDTNFYHYCGESPCRGPSARPGVEPGSDSQEPASGGSSIIKFMATTIAVGMILVYLFCTIMPAADGLPHRNRRTSSACSLGLIFGVGFALGGDPGTCVVGISEGRRGFAAIIGGVSGALVFALVYSVLLYLLHQTLELRQVAGVQDYVHLPTALLALLIGSAMLALMKWLPTEPGKPEFAALTSTSALVDGRSG